MRRLLATGVVLGIAATSPLARAQEDRLMDGALAGVLMLDEAADAWLHERCAYRGLVDARRLTTTAPGEVVELQSSTQVDGTLRASVKVFRCAERPPFWKNEWTPAPSAAVSCTDGTSGLCVPPLAGGDPTATSTPATSTPATSTPATARSLAATPPAAPARPPAPMSTRTLVGWSLVGTGIAGLATGAIAGGMALDARADVRAHCEASMTCDATGLEAADRGASASLVSNIALGVGAAALTGGVVLLAIGKPRESGVGVRAVPSANGGLVRLEGSF